MKYFKLVIRLIIAVILLQTLYYKFTAHPDSVYIFTQVDMEPYGRILIGVLELVASFLLLYGKTVWIGAITAFGLMSGAVFMHLTNLGVEVNGDGGTLFFMAVLVLVLSLITVALYRKQIPLLNL